MYKFLYFLQYTATNLQLLLTNNKFFRHIFSLSIRYPDFLIWHFAKYLPNFFSKWETTTIKTIYRSSNRPKSISQAPFKKTCFKTCFVIIASSPPPFFPAKVPSERPPSFFYGPPSFLKTWPPFLKTRRRFTWNTAAFKKNAVAFQEHGPNTFPGWILLQ